MMSYHHHNASRKGSRMRDAERWCGRSYCSILPRSGYRYSCTCTVGRHAQATIPPSSLRWVVCTRPAHPPSLAAKAFPGLGPRLSHCIRAHILSIFGQSASLSEAGARRAGCWCGTPDLLELVASRSAIDLLFRRGLLVSGKLGFVTMVFSL